MSDQEKTVDAEWQQLAWAIHRRSEIQNTLLGLHTYSKTWKEPEDGKATLIPDHLIAAAFALWRAVFLTHKERTRSAMQEARTKFLRNLVETNAIAFSDDRANSPWSVTFYLETAAHRIMAARDLLNEYAGSEVFKGFKNVQSYHGNPSIEHIQFEWDQTHFHLHRLITFFFKQNIDSAKKAD
jgi:hypothetical protein